MGGQDTLTIKEQIMYKLNEKINTINTNLNEIVNNAISRNTTQTTNTIVNELQREIKSTTDALNLIVGNITASQQATIRIMQQIEARVTNIAIIRILQDGMEELGNNISSSVISEINSNNEARENLEILSKISKQVENQGSSEEFVNYIIAETVEPILLGNSINKEIDITSAINELINNTVITETSFTDIINTTINRKISTRASATCNFNVTAVNWANFNSIKAADNASFNAIQNIELDVFNQCIIDLNMGSAIADDILKDIKFPISNNNISNSTDSNIEKTINPTTAPPSSNNNNILYISLGVGALVVFLILIFFLMSGDNNYYQYGGSSSNLYLYAALFALFLFISTKSITMCGLILLGFVGYILTHN